MRLCHIGWATSIHVQRWVKWFADRGHESHLISDRVVPIEGVMIHQIPPHEHDPRPRWQRLRDLSIHDWRVHRLKTIFWVRNKVREIAPDILHSHTLWYPGYLGLYGGFHPWVVTVFNGDVLWRKDEGVWHKLRTRCALRTADLITGDTKTLMQGCQKLGANPRMTQVIVGGGVDQNRFSPPTNRAEIKKRLGITAPHIVLSPRSVAPLYNLRGIVESIPTVLDRFPGVRVVFIWANAKPEQERELEKCIYELGVENKVILCGSVPYEEIHYYYQIADIVLSIPFQDNLSRCVLEGMACGAVPVVSDLPTLREWVTNEWNGLMVNPHDVNQVAQAIINLLQNGSKRETFARRNDEIMRERGDQDMWMGKMEAMYKSLLLSRGLAANSRAPEGQRS